MVMTLDLILTVTIVAIAVRVIIKRFAGKRERSAHVAIGGALAKGMKRAQARRSVSRLPQPSSSQ
jgi:hypothetical protein